ncbi:MAG: hypothetical protein AB7V13_07970 [Pseudorhodoplanes sp.]|uniref:hypothetical protein n=1 Tax=Pseudorhodoplanes sp. TaxID=1934341 RepID=UPI003D13CDBC
MPNINDHAFWSKVARAANDHPPFAQKSRHLEAVTAALVIDEAVIGLEFHRGKLALIDGPALRGFRFTLRGPGAEWRRVMRQEIAFAQAINVRHGKLRAEGDILTMTWATPALWELFRVTARLASGAPENA